MTNPITIEDIYKLFQKSEEELQKSREEFDRRSEEFHRRSEESHRRSEKFDREMAALLRTVDRTSKAVDALTSRWGRFVEELVEPAVLHLFQTRGIDIKEVHPRAKTRRQGFAMEIDILAVDDSDLVLVECKSRLTKEDVDYFMEKLSRFKDSFPHYKNYQVYGAVAGIEINEGIDRYCYHRGLFVIKPSGNSVMIANDLDFNPVTW